MTMVSLSSNDSLLRTNGKAAVPVALSNKRTGRNTEREVAGACLNLMAELSSADLSMLARFARFRLLRVGLNPADGEDMAQDALLAVLRGRDSSSTGRHPRASDLAGRCAFIAYLHSVIGSLVEAERRCREHCFAHSPLEELVALDNSHASISACDSSLEFSDLKREFFRYLYRQAPARLQDLVAAWDQQCDDCERIPLLGRHRRWRVELRKVAAQAFRKLSNPQIEKP